MARWLNGRVQHISLLFIIQKNYQLVTEMDRRETNGDKAKPFCAMHRLIDWCKFGRSGRLVALVYSPLMCNERSDQVA